jgi:DnaJ family protein A protein 2
VSAWSVLGVPPDASLAQVKSAFRRRALETHPDQGGDAEQFRELAHAYQKVLAKLRTRARRTAP